MVRGGRRAKGGKPWGLCKTAGNWWYKGTEKNQKNLRKIMSKYETNLQKLTKIAKISQQVPAEGPDNWLDLEARTVGVQCLDRSWQRGEWHTDQDVVANRGQGYSIHGELTERPFPVGQDASAPKP
ncbi:hypothetical protein NDU88_011102 [Pleurodeles waltl]|uniref:Uncharacterized protein n=1 Tax=Pleurodeles waltl TaxID=8319 RepID=A0AAV7PWT7_PLEWA|nr:hypothetical protein NDU88_011102 [Pleurodeles waltl]